MIPYMKYHQKNDLHWQWYADQNHTYHKIVDAAIEPFKSAPLGTVVDVGCGDGLVLGMLNNLGFKCFGVEPIQLGVDLAMKHDVSAEFFIEQAEKFAKRGYQFDYLFCLNTIEHLDDPECMVEIMRNIHQFGVIVTDNGDNLHKDSVYHTKIFNPGSFRELFKDFDLTPIPMAVDTYFGFIIKPKKQ